MKTRTPGVPRTAFPFDARCSIEQRSPPPGVHTSPGPARRLRLQSFSGPKNVCVEPATRLDDRDTDNIILKTLLLAPFEEVIDFSFC